MDALLCTKFGKTGFFTIKINRLEKPVFAAYALGTMQQFQFINCKRSHFYSLCFSNKLAVIPAKAGIHCPARCMDASLRWHDVFKKVV